MAFTIIFPWDPIIQSVKYHYSIYNYFGRNKFALLTGVALPLIGISALAGFEYFLDQKRNPIGEKVFESYLQLGTDAPDQEKIYETFNTNTISFIWHIMGHIATHFASSYISTFASRYVYGKMLFTTHELIFTDQNIIKISQCNDQGRALAVMAKYHDLMFSISRNSSYLITQGIRTAVQGGIGLYSLYNIYKNGNFSIKVLLAPFVLNIIQTSIINYLANLGKIARDKAIKENDEYKLSIRDYVVKAKQLFLSNEIDEAKQRTQKRLEAVEKHNLPLDFYVIAQESLNTSTAMLSNFISFLSFGRALYNGTLNHTERTSIETSLEKIISLIGFGNEVSQMIRFTSDCIEDINYLLGVINQPFSKATREFEHSDKLIIDNFKMTLKSHDEKGEESSYVLQFNDITLSKGDICLLRGPSGSGKSTLICQLVGLIQRDYVKTSGAIKFPCKQEEVVLVAQKDESFYGYTLNDTLLVGIHPTKRNEASDKIIKLLTELGLDNDLVGRLNEVVNFGSDSASGGQQKLIKLINAILKQPKVLIVDEILTGLSDEFKNAAQKAIKNYLEDTIIISIAHGEKPLSDGLHTHVVEIIKKPSKGRVESQCVGIKPIN